MEYFTIRKPDGNTVSCLKEIPEHLRGIVLAIHGFSSSKECTTYQLLLRRMPPEGYGVIGIDLPGHGSGESSREELRIEGALNSIEAAERYAAEHFPGVKLCYFASSFGAYLTGLYISTRPHLGRKAFFRSAAVNMPQLFVKEKPGEEDRKRLADLKNRGYFEANVETSKPVRITRGMYHDFETTDLFQVFNPSRFVDTAVKMVHGAEDDVIDPKEAERFASMFRVPLTVLGKEGHSLSRHTDTPDRVADLALEFYENGE